MAVVNKIFDKRTITRNINKGLVTDAEFQSHLKSLPDETENAEWVNLDLDEAELTSEEQEDDQADAITDEDLDAEETAQESNSETVSPVDTVAGPTSADPQGDNH